MRVLDPSHSGSTPTGNRSLAGCRPDIREIVKDSNFVLAAIAWVGLHGLTEAPLSLLIVNTHLFRRPAYRVDDLVIRLAVIEL